MLEVVVLREVMSSYASTWVYIAKTAGTETIRIGDVFREVGFGNGAEEMKVESFELSPIAGASRLQLLRAFNRTPPQTYRVGAVLRRLEPEVKEVVAAGPKSRKRSDQGINDLLADI